MKDYFVFTSSIEGGWIAGPMTKEEVESGLASENWQGTFHSKQPRQDGDYFVEHTSQKHGHEAALVIRGEIVVPREVETVTKWEIPK